MQGKTRRSKGMDPEQSAAVRRLLQQLVNDDFKGNESATARALGVSQSLVYEMLSGIRGAGPRLIESIANYRGISFDEVVGRVVGESKDRVVDALYPNRGQALSLATTLGYSAGAIRAVQSLARQDGCDISVRQWLELVMRHEQNLRDLGTSS